MAARARAQAEVDKQRQALARLRADRAANPEDFGPGEYEETADLIRKKRAEAQALLDSTPETEPLPKREKLITIARGLLKEWGSFEDGDINLVYRQLIRRVAIKRNGPGPENHEIEIHPLWEPDPWPAKTATAR